MHVRRTDALVMIHAPAKINLFLEVLARRPDGFHEITTLMAAVSHCDTLVFAPQEGSDIEFECRVACGAAAQQVQRTSPAIVVGDIPSGRENLAWRAMELLRQRAGFVGGARVLLVKRIPAAAGLGGASSDAAAALVAANLGWGLGWSLEKLSELAAELGSDVPFFLTGGAAICRGRGEQIEALRAARMHVVVARPPVGLSTPAVYRACQPAPQPANVRSLWVALGQGDLREVGSLLLNRLQSPAATLTDWIDRLAVEFARVNGANRPTGGHQMSGSGSSYFGLCRSARHARRQAARLRARKLGVVFAATTAVG